MRKSVFSKFVTLFGCVAFTFSSLFLVSCEIGMGESVDLEAPTIKLTKMVSGGTDVEHTDFDASIFCRSSVTFYGTAHDNEELTGVHAEIKWLGENSYKFLANATLDDEKWVLALKFPKEGACWLKIVAEDKTGNYGIRSSKVISLFVDNNAPSGNGWYIDRQVAGVQYNLQGLSTLKDIVSKDPNLTQPSNKDVAQNQNFKISANFSDASGIEVVSISIYDEAGNKIVDNIAKDTDSSNYAPFFSLSHDIITQNDTNSLKSGLHYLQVRYSAADTVTDPSPNTVEDAEFSLGWFIWWPESDNPKYSITGLESSGDQEYLHLNISDTVNITVFDDDFLSGSIKCVLTESGNASPLVITETKPVTEGSRELSVPITAPDKPMTMKLNISATATSGEPLNREINVTVSDDSLPTLIIETPENNQIPEVTGTNSEINFKGETLDKAGCTYLEFVWVPSSAENKNTTAKAWLDSIKNSHEEYAPTGSASVQLKEGTGTYDGLKLWSAKLTNAGTDSSNTFTKQTFDFKLKLLTDFGDDKTKDKYFLIRLTRKDGNYTDTEFKLSADNLRPEIKALTPAGNMQIVDQSEDLYLMFYAEKESGLAMDEDEYKAYYVNKNTTTPISGSVVEQKIDNIGTKKRVFKSVKIPAADLATFADNNENPTYRFTAKDILGNSNFQDYQIILSSLPTLESISSTAPVKCKKGDVIRINVSFTKSVSLPETATLKLTNIENATKGISATDTDKVVAVLDKNTNGSTTLVFNYTVQEGDTSEELHVYNEPDKGPINGVITGAHVNTLDDSKNLQKKRTIKIDGVSPKVTEIEFETDADEDDNIVSNISYLKAGRTITAKVTTDKKVTVQKTPEFKFTIKGTSDTLNLKWQKTIDSDTGSILYFSKKIESLTKNGELTYKENTCIDGKAEIDAIKDGYQNNLLVNLGNTDTAANITIDTNPPGKPKISATKAEYNDDNNTLMAGKYQNQVDFTITKADKAKTYYSKNGGTSWIEYSNKVELMENATLVAKTIDYAGNVSDYSDPIDVEVESTFPTFTVECTKPDGHYKAGTELTFKVFFARPVKVSSTSKATITLSNYNLENGSTDENTIAKIDSKWLGKENLYEVTFTYHTRDPDQFNLKIDEDAIDLDGFEDEFHITQGSAELSEVYTRENLRCDGVAPKVISMVPGGAKGNNVYDNAEATTITLTFSEDVQLGTGKIYLRQIKGWAIPPVLTDAEFNTICNTYPEGKNTLSIQENGSDMQDSAWNGDSSSGRSNTGYHGTGQYVGPYKKSSLGVDSNGKPDTSTKYVLDFDMDIWETNKTHYYDRTFTPDKKTPANETYVTPAKNPRTADDIRSVLEKVHYHERYTNASATNIVGDTVTIKFPKGLLADSALPYGRKWELVIEKGCFMDTTGNKFGAEPNGDLKKADAVQEATGSIDTSKQYTIYSGTADDDGYAKYTGSWARGRNEVNFPADEKGLVLINNNGYEYFESDKVAIPVIRVDRYSYGNGIFQSNSDGSTTQIAGQATKPTGYARVRIDCETEDAKVIYNYKGNTNNLTTNTTAVYTDKPDQWRPTASTYMTTTTTELNNVSLTTGTNNKTLTKANGSMPEIIFALGSGQYNQSYKGYVKAKAELSTHTANATDEIAQEGVFQTVIHFVSPEDNQNDNCASHNGVFSIRGTTNKAGEPTISPFPLRDNQLLSPFIRQTFKQRSLGGNLANSNDYYWISYEILVDSCFSGHSSSKKAWISQWGLMSPGEFTRVTDLRCW